MFIRPWLETLKSRWMPAKRRTSKRLNQRLQVQSQVETLEEKIVLSAFDLVTVIPNQGVFLANNTTLSEAPRELTLRFSPGQNIDAASAVRAISVTRAGLDGIFDDPSTPAVESSDDVSVDLGYVGAGENPNEVIVRFASTLPDDKYQVRIQTTGGNALVGNTGDALTPDAGKTYKTFSYELDLGAQVEAVVPQPVIRSQIFSTTQFSSLTDGDIVSINAGPYSYRFEINLTGGVANTSIAVNVTAGATPTQIANALVSAINSNAGTQLTASNSGNLITVAGTSFEPVVSFATAKFDAFAKSNLNIIGNGAQFADGDLIRLTLTNPTTSVNTVYTFELNKLPNNSVGGGNIRVDFNAADDQATIAGKLATAINNSLPLNTPTVKQVLATVVGTSIAVTSSSALGTPALTWVTGTAGVLTQTVGTLAQKTNQVVVYFNQDQLDQAIAQDPTYYRLINTATGTVVLPQSVTYRYNPQNGLSVAVLTFASSLSNAAYNLKVGVSSEPNGTSASTANATKVGTVFNGNPFQTNEYLGDGSGNSADDSDVDLYQFSTVASGTYTITLNPTANLDGIIEVLDSSGNVIYGPQNMAGADGIETLPTGILGASTFYVRVTSATGTGGYQLTISSNEVSGTSDNNSSFTTATDLGNLGAGGIDLTSQIEPQNILMPPLPGGPDEPGHRDLPPGAFTGFSAPEVGHGIPGGTNPAAPSSIPEVTYSFPLTYGTNLTNQITPEQKEIIRQIFQIYSYYAGIQFREVASGGQEQIVVGDIRVNAPTLDPGAAGGISGSPIIINAIYYANDNTYGGGFTSTAFHEIGHNLGLGHSYDIPSDQGAGVSGEGVFPGDNDLIHLLRLLPNNSSDIDLYKFSVAQSGILSAQTVAQRLGVSNLLDSELTLYRQDPSGAKVIIARNDDFYSKDSGIEIALQPGTYFIGVTSTGNDQYDPTISNSGFGGTSDGQYQLKLDFKPDAVTANGLRDATGKALDGDHDGKAGGEYNTWFEVANTVFVDKLAPAGGDGTIGLPYQTISAGLAAAGPGTNVRIVGNGGADGDASTVADNVPYAIGRDYNLAQTPLADGGTFQIPKDVTVMIDAGALIKVHGQTIDVGTSSLGIDRSGGALQVLGTPVNNVTFTSWRDDSKGSIDDGTNGAATGADWGGIVFRQDSDVNSGLSGVFLNQVNHATLQYGGGQVSVDGGPLRVYNVIDLETSRPTITNNIIKNNADAAISANPDSFKADDGRIGPDVHGNLVTQNSTNGLFIRIQTALGSDAETLNVIARFDDTDITHVIAQNLIINGAPAGSLDNPLSARLMIDPGTIIKLSGARIETGLGSSNLIAEGTAENPIRFTSQQDDRYGAGGSFDLKNDGFAANAQPAAGNWAGIFLQPTSTASLDNVSISFAGGSSEIAGNTDNFNPIEVWQAKLRVANSVFEDNAGGAASTTRGGRGGNDASVIYVRGAQPVIVDNVFRDNAGNVISINANSMQDVVMPDYGRSTGAIDRYSSFDDNYGPLVRLNRYENNSINGMNIRPEELTIESIWDDTDIAHVLTGTITSNEFHTYGGLRLQSNSTGSLVVKLQGDAAGFAATGDPLEISDRVGGTVQVVGQPGFPVILTSLKDDTVSAGFLPNGFPLFDTNNDDRLGVNESTPQPGDWNSLSFDQYSNDRNVAVVNETETPVTHGNDVNSTTGNPQQLGNLAPNENSGDENRRLGFEVHGFISPDSPGDVDVYSFTANAGTEVWIDIDQTSYGLDTMVELVNAAGVVLARSLNSQDESLGLYPLTGTLFQTVNGAPGGPGNSDLNTLTKDSTLGGDFYTSNFHDAGFRVVLPGATNSTNTYFVRVRSQPVAGQEAAAIPPGGNGLTSGKYELQVRLRQQDEQPGSTVRYADIRYATNGVELRGLPAHSIIMGESAEQQGDNNSPGGSQNLGPLLQTDRNTISVSGSLTSASDVDYYTFTLDYSQVQVIGGASDGGKFFPTMFDIDWADGLTRPDTTIAVYNSDRQLIYIGRASDLADDQPAPGQGQDLDDLSRGSLGTLDPSIGTVNLPAGVAGESEAGGVNPDPPPSTLTTYYVAVFSNGMLPKALTANFGAGSNPGDEALQLVRLEPVNSIRRVVEDHIGFTGYSSQGSTVAPVNGPLFNTTNSISLEANIRPFSLSDVNLFVTTDSQLAVVDPFNGNTEIMYGAYGVKTFQDLDMRSDGTLWGVRYNAGNIKDGSLININTGTAGDLSVFGDGIADVDGDNTTQRFQSNDAITTAMTFRRSGVGTYDYVYYAQVEADDYVDNPNDPAYGNVSKLYRGSAASGSAAWTAGDLGATGLITDDNLTIKTQTMGMQYFGGQLWGVSSGNQLYVINDGASPGGGGSNVGNPDNSATLTATSYLSTKNLVSGTILDYSLLLDSDEHFAGITDAPQNVENSRFADFLFIITDKGRIICVDPTADTAAESMQTVFDSGTDNIADSQFLQTDFAGATGLAFSPVDYNLWHPTASRGNEAGHGVNSTTGTIADPNVDNSRVPGTEPYFAQFGDESLDSTEGTGGASMYFGVEAFAPGGGNYFEYDSDGQYGVQDFLSQQDLNANIRNNYNVPGGTAGSLVTNSFNLEGYSSTDEPVLYFNYWLQTEGANGKALNSMRDSARVYVSTDNGVSWQLVATNNSALSSSLVEDAELPAYLSTSSNASAKSNQGVQELYETASWRQARVDLRDYVGNTQVKLRFDFSTSGRSGTVIDPNTGVRVPGDDTSDPTYEPDTGDDNGVSTSGASSSLRAQANTGEGFYIDDIIVGFAGRGEMVTNAPAGAAGESSIVNLINNEVQNTLGGRPTKDPDLTATPQLLTGNYQLEIRRGEEYGALFVPTKNLVAINPVLDINDRLATGQTIAVGNNITDGDYVTIYDGIVTKTFEFDTDGTYTNGNIPVNVAGLNTVTDKGVIAGLLASQITSSFASRKTVIAKAIGVDVNSDRVDIFGAISVIGSGTPGVTTAIPGQVEDNDTLATATDSTITAISNGNFTASGQIGNGSFGGSDVDLYKMVLDANQTIEINMGHVGGDSMLRIFDAAGNPLALNDDGPTPGESPSLQAYLSFVAPAAGTYYFGVSGYDNRAYDPETGGSGVIGSTFSYTISIIVGAPSTALTVETYNRRGDDNLQRQQGQFIVENNTILHSEVNGVWIDDNDRFGTVPHPGAAMNTPVTTAQALVTGLYVQNNVIAGFGQSGVEIEGDPNSSLGKPITPFVKVVNNSIINTGNTGFGIRIRNNASPTLMNNAIVGTNTSISIDGTSSTTEVEANLFQDNTSNPSLGNNSLVVANGVQLFVDPSKDNYYPAPGSPLIDSSRSVFNDRAAYVSVVGPLGIPQSPIIAPIFDRFGQLRVDDGSQAGPPGQPGLGQNPFQDRGAVERADFDGGLVIPTVPQDNDGSGFDLDPAAASVWIDAATVGAEFSVFTTFKLQLIDAGIGIDDSTVNAGDFLLLQNGSPLVEGQDYFFTYNQNTNEAIFTSVSTFALDSRYQIILDAGGIQDLAGNDLQNNQTQPVADNPNIPGLPSPLAVFKTSQLYFTYIITDGKNDAPTVAVGGVNVPAAPPVIVNEDDSVTFSSTITAQHPVNNAITVFDQDAFLAGDGDPNTGTDGGRITVTITITPSFVGNPDAGDTTLYGSFSLADPSVTDALVAHGGSFTFTNTQYILEGRIDDIKAALEGLTFTPIADFPPNVPSTVQLTVETDDDGKFGPATPVTPVPTYIIPIQIMPVNDAPTLTVDTPPAVTTAPGKVTILEDAGATVLTLSNITAGGGETQTLQVTATSSDTTIIPNPSVTYTSANTDGTVSFTPLANQFTAPGVPVIITIQVTDAGPDGIFGDPGTGIIDDLTTTRTIEVTVTSVNDVPTLGPITDPPAVDEDSPQQTITLTGVSGGPANEDQELTYHAEITSGQNIVDNFIFTPTSGGEVTLAYTPIANAFGTAVVTVTVTDSDGATNTPVRTFTITLNPVNDPPTVDQLGNRTILEDDPSNPQQFLLTGITPGPFGETGTVTNITVTSNNQTVVPDANIVQGTYDSVAGTLPLTITPVGDVSGPVIITVSLTDDGGLTRQMTFTLNVTPVNDPPILGPIASPAAINEDDGQQTIQLSGIFAGPPDETGQPLTISASITSGNTNLVSNFVYSTVAADGTATLKYTPVANQNGTAVITVIVNDGALDSAPQTFTVTVNPVNDPPTMNNISNPPTILEDAPEQTITLTGLTGGPADENQALTFSATVISGPTIVGNFTFGPVVGQQATMKYTPILNANGTAVVQVTATDSSGATVQRTFTVVITPVNDPPVIGPITSPAAIDEDAGQQTIQLSGIFAGPPDEVGQPLTISASITGGNTNLVNNFVYSTVAADGTATLKYTPVANQNGTAVITVIINDGALNSTPRTFTVTVNAVNDLPTMNNISIPPTILEDAPEQTITLTGLTGGPADENQALTFSATVISGPTIVGNFTFGPVVGQQATMKYTPILNANGTAVVQVTATDSSGATVQKTFTVVITPVNDPPTLGPIASPAPINEDAGQQTIQLSGVFAGPPDEAGQPLTIFATISSGTPNLVSNFVYGTVAADGTATLKYTPVPNAVGTAVITVTISDGVLVSAPQSFTVVVNPVNDDPTMNPITDPPAILEDSSERILTLSGLTGGPSNESQALTLSAEVISGEAIVGNFTFSSVVGQSATLRYTPVPNANGSAVVRVTATDSSGAIVQRTFTVTIIPVNDPATLDPIQDQHIDEDAGPQSIGLTGISVGPLHEVTELPTQTLTFTVTSDNPSLIPNLVSNLSVNYVQGSNVAQLIYQTLPNAHGVANITVRLTDSGLPAGSGDLVPPITFKITVDPQPDAPTDISLSNNIALEQKPAGTLVGTLSTTDVDLPGDTFTYTIEGGTGAAFFNIPTGTNQLKTSQPLIYANSPGGVYTLIIQTKDSNGLFFQKTITIENSPNTNPTDIQLSNDRIPEIAAGTALPANVLVGTLSTIDPEAIDTHTYTLVGGADVASFKIVGNQLIAVGPLDYDTHADGFFTVVIRSTDSHSPAGFLDKTFTIRTTNVNEPATAISIAPNLVPGVPNSIPENQPANTIVGKLLATDPDAGDTAVSFALVNGAGSADNLLFKIVDGNLVTNGTFNYEARNTYTVRIRTTDAGGLSFETPVVISITNVNEVATNINLSGNTVVENSPAGTVIGNFTTNDPDVADTFTYTPVSGVGDTDNDKFEIVNGVLRVVTPPNYEDPGHVYSIRVRSTDSGNPQLFIEKTFTIVVTNVNESPTGLVLSNTTVAENKPVGTVVGLLGTDDPDFPEGFTYSLVAGTGADDNNLFSIAGDKLVTATTFDFEGGRTTFSVRVQTRDTEGLTFEKTFTITITDAFDAPVITLTGTHAATTGRKAVLVDSSAQITDIDTTDFNGGKLVVKIQAGEQIGDTLSIAKGASFNGLKLKTFRGKTVLKLGKTEIATVSGGVRAIPLTIQFTTQTSTDLIRTVMQSIAFKGKPFAAPRVVSMQVFDDKGLGSNIATRNIDVT